MRPFPVVTLGGARRLANLMIIGMVIGSSTTRGSFPAKLQSLKK